MKKIQAKSITTCPKRSEAKRERTSEEREAKSRRLVRFAYSTWADPSSEPSPSPRGTSR